MAPREPHVALNALFLDPGVTGGPETYLRSLVPRLVERHPSTRFTLLTSGRGARSLVADGWRDLLPIVALPADDDERVRRTAVELAQVPAVARRRGADVVHSLSNRGPLRAGADARHVVTIHDAIFFTHRTLGLVSTLGMRASVRAAARRADAVITDSAAARDEVVQHVGVDPGRITVVHLGAGRPVAVAAPDAGVRAELGLGNRRVVLCTGALRPHKNQELLVRALPELPDDVALVCAGAGEGYEQRVSAVASELGVGDRLVLPGYVSDAELEALWRLASVAAFPTRVEGFGLPVLEAMQRGVPVACSDIPVLRELAGDTVRWFSPGDPRSAAAAIAAALAEPHDPAPARDRAARFTWDRSADETHAVYERVLA